MDMRNAVKRRRVSLVAIIAVAGVVSMSACTSGQEAPASGDGGTTDGTITIAFLQKQGDQQ